MAKKDKKWWQWNKEQMFGNVGWLIVLTVAFSFSTWSIHYVLNSWGVPTGLAWLGSTALDGAAFVTAHIALQGARKYRERGVWPRFLTAVFVGISMYVNWQHGVMAHQIIGASIAYAVFPFLALAIYDSHQRWVRRSAKKDEKRPETAPPTYSPWVWFDHPWLAFSIRRHLSAKIIVDSVKNEPDNIKALAENSLTYSTAFIRAWLLQNGFADVPKRGRIPKNMLDIFWAAHTVNEERAISAAHTMNGDRNVS